MSPINNREMLFEIAAHGTDEECRIAASAGELAIREIRAPVSGAVANDDSGGMQSLRRRGQRHNMGGLPVDDSDVSAIRRYLSLHPEAYGRGQVQK